MSGSRCVLGCESKSVLFSLPKLDDVKNRWLQFIFSTIPQQYNSNLFLCARHFTDDCFSDFDAGFIKRLKDGSVPTLLAPGNLSESQPDVCGQSSVDVSDGSSTECLDSVWSSRDQSKPQPLLDKLSEQKSRHTQDSELSLTLLCYTDTNPTDAQHTVCDSNHTLNQDESTDQTSTESLDSVCNAGQQQILNTIPLNKCSVQLMDCRKLMEMRRQTTVKEEEEEHHTDEDENHDDDENGCDDDDFIPSDEGSDSCSDGEMASTSEEDTETKMYKCPHCVKRFDNPSYRKQHVHRIHSDERAYLCSECGKTFKDITSLKSHQRTHTEKLYQCSHCDKRFHHKPNLMLHERTHTGEKPYLCSHCGKRFSQSCNFKDHLRIHTGEKPHLCSQCGKRFTNSKGFKLHQRTHTGEKPYPCDVCGKSFTRPDNLRTHQRLHTGEKPYKCRQCDKAFTQNVLLKLHQKVHRGEKSTRLSARKDSLV